jgi:hypothetical protein
MAEKIAVQPSDRLKKKTPEIASKPAVKLLPPPPISNKNNAMPHPNAQEGLQ